MGGISMGDALETLKADSVLKLLEPPLRGAGIVASDNTDHQGMEVFLTYLRDPANGYTSAAITTAGTQNGHEITLRH